MAGLADDLGARIIVFIYAMAKTHEPEGVILVLGPLHKLLDIVRVLNLLEHVDHGLVGAAMGLAPEGADAGGDAGEGIAFGAGGQAHRRGRGVLLMIGVQDEQQVQGPYRHRIRMIFLAGPRKHHGHQVFDVTAAAVRIYEGQTRCVAVTLGRQGGHLGNDAARREQAVLGIADIGGVVVVGGDGPEHAGHDGHGMGIVAVAGIEARQVLMGVAVQGDGPFPFIHLPPIGQFAMDQQVAGLQVGAVLRQLLDGIAPVHEHALFPVQVGDRAAAACRGGEARIIGEHTQLAIQLAGVDDRSPVYALFHRTLDLFAGPVVNNSYRIRHLYSLPWRVTNRCISVRIVIFSSIQVSRKNPQVHLHAMGAHYAWFL